MAAPPFRSRSRTFFSPDFPIHVEKYSHPLGTGRLHDHEYGEIAFVLSGQGRHISAAADEAFRKGTIFWIPPGAVHHYVTREPGELFNVLFSSEWIHATLAPHSKELPTKKFPGFILDSKPSPLSFSVRPPVFIRLRAILERLAEECKAPRECRGLVVTGLFLEFVGVLVRSAELLSASTSGRRDGKELGPLLSFVQKHFQESWALEDLARRFSFHPNYLSRVFRKNTGYTLPEYINELRLREAARLLKTTDLSILDVSLACGYEHLSWFNRSFKKTHGQSPSALRKSRSGAAEDKKMPIRQ